MILNYEGESAELYQDGRLVADSFYTGQSWEIGLKELAHQQEADLIVVIHPLKESAGIYLEKWPVMKHHRACRLVNAETAAIVRLSENSEAIAIKRLIPMGSLSHDCDKLPIIML